MVEQQETTQVDYALSKEVSLFLIKEVGYFGSMIHEAVAERNKAILGENESIADASSTAQWRIPKILNTGIRSLTLEERIYLDAHRDEMSVSVGRNLILRILGTRGSLSREDLEKACATVPNFDREIFNRMEQEGLLVCSADPAGNRKNDMMTLTASGIAAWNDLDERSLERSMERFESFTSDEKEEFLRLLRKLNNSW